MVDPSSTADSSNTLAGRSHRNRWTAFGVGAAMIVLALVAVEIVVRVMVGSIAAREIEKSLPGEVHADIDATPTGACVTCEVIRGRLSHLDVRSDDLAVQDISGRINLIADGVTYRNGPATADRITGTLDVDESQLNELLRRVAANTGLSIQQVRLSDRGISYVTQVDVFGRDYQLQVTANIAVRGNGQLQVLANEIQIGDGSNSAQVELDADRFSFQACIADRLPKELELTSVETQAQHVRLHFRTSAPVTFDDQVFKTPGTCG